MWSSDWCEIFLQSQPPPSSALLCLLPLVTSPFAFRLSVNLSSLLLPLLLLPLLLLLSPVANCHTSSSFSQDPKCFWNLAPFTHPAGGKHTHTDTDTDTRSVDRQSSTWGQAQIQWPEERTSTAGNLPRMDWTSRKNKHFSKYEEHLRILLLFLPTDFTPNIRDYWHQHEHEEEEKWTGHQLAQVHLHSGSVEKRYSPFHEKQNCYNYWKIESEKIQHDRRLWNFTHKWYSSSANRTASITWLRKS